MAFRGFPASPGVTTPAGFDCLGSVRTIVPVLLPLQGTGISRASTIRTCDGNDGGDGNFDSESCCHRAVGPLCPLERAGRTAAPNFSCGASPHTPHSPWGRRKDRPSFLRVRVWRSAFVKPFRGISSLASLAPVFHGGLTTLPRGMVHSGGRRRWTGPGGVNGKTPYGEWNPCTAFSFPVGLAYQGPSCLCKSGKWVVNWLAP